MESENCEYCQQSNDAFINYAFDGIGSQAIACKNHKPMPSFRNLEIANEYIFYWMKEKKNV